jgi:copper(I)-binding protein
MFGLTKHRLVEIGVALVLTLASLVFIGLTAWGESARLRVADPWARPTIGEGRTTAAYMTIANEGGGGDVLKGARSEKAKAVELHQTTVTAEGVVKMRKVEDGLPVAPSGSLVLEPGGAHLMVVGLDEALAAGDELPLTLEFASAGAVDVRAPVSAAAPPAAGASEHHHH